MSDASFNKGATVIALRALPALGGRSFQPGDVVPWRQMALAERLVRLMHEQRTLGSLSPENYAFAMRQRSDGVVVARGHTADGLASLGIDVGALKADAPAKKAEPGVPEVREGEWTPPAGSERYGEVYWLVPQLRGKFTFYDVNAVTDGARLNPGGLFRGRTAAVAWCDQQLADKARIDAEKPADLSESTGSDTSTNEGKGEGDVGELRSESEGSGQ
jgi:hypothetical protein